MIVPYGIDFIAFYKNTLWREHNLGCARRKTPWHFANDAFTLADCSNLYAQNSNGNLDTNEPAVEYLYANNRLSSIETATTEYTLTYDTFGNLKTVKAGNKTLATYNYAANNGKLTSLTYGNGDYETYTYDHLDRLIKVVYNGVADSGYELQYDANGRLFQTIDREAGITHTYEYDSLDRLIRAWQKNTSTGSVILGVENSYDEYGRAKGSTVITGGKKLAYTITYDEDTNLVSSVRLPTTSPDSAYNYDYDNFDRVITEQISLSTLRDYYTDYTYQTYTDDEGNVFTSNLVSTLTLRVSSGGTTTSEVYGYTYDALGNITAITKNGLSSRIYTYDSLNRLKRESNYDTLTHTVYSYDNAGNILSKEEQYWGGTTKSRITYGYSTSAWGDLLTNYNGTTITYDAIGNPLKWRNATSMSWDKRSLQSMTLSNGTAVSFQYNSDGIRTQKTVGSTTHSYVLDGTNIQSETVTGASNYTLYYIYDASGSVIGFHYNNVPYYFHKNLQGDVIRILDTSGNIVTEYKYDAWGNILSITGTQADAIGQYNPFRYRGYYYDTETGFYYLQSRYYDPQVGRFINADGYVSTGQGLAGFNMFAYCNNNPVCMKDATGTKGVVVTTPDDGNPNNDWWGGPLGGGMSSNSGSSGGTVISRSRSKTKITDPTVNQLINNQPDYKTDYIGWFPINSNGCEVIAIHNVKVLLGYPSSLSQTVSDVEHFLLLKGALGILPGQLTDIFDYYGMSYSVSNINSMTQEGVYIVSYFSSFPIIHTVAVEYDGTKYTTYNIGKGGKERIYTGHPYEYTGDAWLAVIYLGTKEN